MIGFKTDVESEKKESKVDSNNAKFEPKKANAEKGSSKSVENLENIEKPKKETTGKKSKSIVTLIILFILFVTFLLIFSNIQKKMSSGGIDVTTTEGVSTATSTSEATTEQKATTSGEKDSTATEEGAVYDDNGKLVSENGVYDLDGNLITDDEDAIDVGLPDFKDSDVSTTTATVYSDSDYIKDLNGVDIPAVYNVKSRDYIKDFANYEAKRAIIDDGMEMYWLEITYNKKKYRCQVPYYVFKDLDKTGICVVEIEVLTLEGGEKIISYMQVVTDYSDLK